MAEIELTGTPATRRTLAEDLAALGVRPGSVMLVHSSLKSLGWVCGGPVAVVQALLDALGPHGTLVVPTHTPDNSDPAGWQHPPVPESWWAVIREQMPAYDPAVTPSRWMGVIAEAVRTWPGARRSEHPQVSFAAIGPAAEAVVGGHRLDEMLGEASPLGAVYRLDGDVLLLGAQHYTNTSLHLAEYRVPQPPRVRLAACVRAAAGGGAREWVWWEDVDIHEHDFARLGEEFDATGEVAIGPVGAAQCRLMRQRALVDFAAAWFPTHR